MDLNGSKHLKAWNGSQFIEIKSSKFNFYLFFKINKWRKGEITCKLNL